MLVGLAACSDDGGSGAGGPGAGGASGGGGARAAGGSGTGGEAQPSGGGGAGTEQAGSLDTSFGASGVATFDAGFDDRGRAVAIDPDGKVIVAGKSNDDFLLARFQPSGSVDSQFGSAGAVFTDIGTSYDEGKSLAAIAGGKILLAGISTVGGNANFSIARYLYDGSLDLGFSGDGKATVGVSSGSDEGKSLIVQSDGKLVIAGKTFNGTDDDFLVVRFVESGELDPSFGAGGLVIVDVAGFDDEGNSVRQQPDGKLVVAGYSSNGADEDFAVLRLDLDGGLDDTFGVGGIAVTPLGEGADIAFGAALQSDGSIVLGGISFDGTQNQLAAARFEADGDLDATFDGDGLWTGIIGGMGDECTSIAVDDAGRLLLGGTTFNGSDRDFALVRLLPNGAFDTAFGEGGVVTTPIGDDNDGSFSMALAPDGRIVLAGETDNGVDFDLAVARFHP